MLIEKSAKFLRWIYPHALWRMDKNDHSVYLTFDDGPIPESTPFILETLRRFNVKATFFMVGENVLRYHDLYNQIIQEGHQVGNHTFNHVGSFKHWTLTYGINTEMANDLIKSHLFRPPHGWMRLSVYWWLRRRYTIVMWDLVRRRCTQRKTLYPERLYYYFSRFAQKYRQTKKGTSRVVTMVKGARLHL